MKKYAIFIIAIILLLVAALAISRLLLGKNIDVVHPIRGEAVQAVYATGTVEPTVMMPIAARSAARLMELNVDEGSHVTKGQVLAQLEDTDLQHSIKELIAREEFARKEFERSGLLFKNNVVPKKTYEQSKSEWEAAKEAVKMAQAQAGYLKLSAPEDGLIIKRDGETGQLIAANAPVFWLSCCAPLRISAEVDEEDISQVKAGQEVLIRADAFNGQVFKGSIQAITPKGDPITRSYRVRVEFTEDTPLQIGMTAETNIIISKKQDAILVPSSSVNKDRIWVIADGKLLQKKITPGAKGTAQTEIIEGVRPDDMVVVKPEAEMEEGKKVHAVLSEQNRP